MQSKHMLINNDDHGIIWMRIKYILLQMAGKGLNDKLQDLTCVLVHANRMIIIHQLLSLSFIVDDCNLVLDLV